MVDHMKTCIEWNWVQDILHVQKHLLGESIWFIMAWLVRVPASTSGRLYLELRQGGINLMSYMKSLLHRAVLAGFHVTSVSAWCDTGDKKGWKPELWRLGISQIYTSGWLPWYAVWGAVIGIASYSQLRKSIIKYERWASRCQKGNWKLEELEGPWLGTQLQ
jgi:hypothetical protein